MLITLITACRNAAATLPTALESVVRQRLSAGAELEHIVIDGASTDGTPRLLADWQDRLNRSPVPHLSFRYVSEPDRGLYDAINKGIALSTGEAIGILNADDLLASDTVIAQISAAFARPSAPQFHAPSTSQPLNLSTPQLHAVYGTVRFVNEPGGPTVRRCFARLWRPWMLQWGYMPPHPAIFIRHNCFTEWGGYIPDRQEYRIAADFELLIRFFRVHRMCAAYIPLCTTIMRTGGLSTRDLEARRRLNAEIIKGNRTNGYFCCWPMLLPKYLVKVWEILLPRLGHPGH